MARAPAVAMGRRSRRTLPPSSPRGGLRGCRWPTSPGNRAALPTRRSTARSSSSATRQAPLSAPTSKPELDELGATTLVLCGALATHALEASAWHAADLGYQVFVVADACRAVDTADLGGRLWLAEDVRTLALARLKGETATIVDVATTLRAAATAKARQRRGAGRA